MSMNEKRTVFYNIDKGKKEKVRYLFSSED